MAGSSSTVTATQLQQLPRNFARFWQGVVSPDNFLGIVAFPPP
jgi:hypothetical protein